MHPLRKLREAGPPTPAQVAEILAENVVFNSPLLTHPIEGRAVVAQVIANSATSRDGVGDYVGEYKLDDPLPDQRDRASLMVAFVLIGTARVG